MPYSVFVNSHNQIFSHISKELYKIDGFRNDGNGTEGQGPDRDGTLLAHCSRSAGELVTGPPPCPPDIATTTPGFPK